jgi:hypothetical protein
MMTRWFTLLAALCLTVMALGTGRAAHAASMAGHGLVGSSFGELVFVVNAQSKGRNQEGYIRVEFDRGLQVHLKVKTAVFNIGPQSDSALLTAVVSISNDPRFPPGAVASFFFVDNGASGDRDDEVQSDLFGIPNRTPLTLGAIRIKG